MRWTILSICLTTTWTWSQCQWVLTCKLIQQKSISPPKKNKKQSKIFGKKNSRCSARASSLVDTRSESATILCLICGEMLCSQQFCYPKEIFKRRVGSCTAHAYECGGTIGVFLRVAECQVLLIHLNINSSDDMQVRGAFVPAPYLDDYGETDQGLRFICLWNNYFFKHIYILIAIFFCQDGAILYTCAKRDTINSTKIGFLTQYPKKYPDRIKIRRTL